MSGQMEANGVPIVNGANCTLAYFSRRVSGRLWKWIIPVSSELVTSHLDYCVWLLPPPRSRGHSKMGREGSRGLLGCQEQFTCFRRSGRLQLFILVQGGLRGDVIASCNHVNGSWKEDRAKFFVTDGLSKGQWPHNSSLGGSDWPVGIMASPGGSCSKEKVTQREQPRFAQVKSQQTCPSVGDSPALSGRQEMISRSLLTSISRMQLRFKPVALSKPYLHYVH